MMDKTVSVRTLVTLSMLGALIYMLQKIWGVEEDIRQYSSLNGMRHDHLDSRRESLAKTVEVYHNKAMSRIDHLEEAVSSLLAKK